MFQGNTDVGDTNASAVFAATVDIDPGAGVVLAGVLAYNGGPVKTIALNKAAANPAVDAGDDDGVPATDARGVARTDSGSPDGDGDITDLGAFEVTLPRINVRLRSDL